MAVGVAVATPLPVGVGAALTLAAAVGEGLAACGEGVPFAPPGLEFAPPPLQAANAELAANANHQKLRIRKRRIGQIQLPDIPRPAAVAAEVNGSAVAVKHRVAVE